MNNKPSKKLVLSELYLRILSRSSYSVFEKNRCPEIPVPAAVDIAAKFHLPKQSAWIVYSDLVSKKIFSKKGSGRGAKYFLEYPQYFKQEVKQNLLALLKKPISFILPPAHRQKNRVEQSNLIMEILGEYEDQVAMIFSSPFIVSPSDRYKRARIMQYRAAPIFMSGPSTAIDNLEIQLGLKRVKITNHLVSHGFYYPDDPSIADLIYFDSDAMGVMAKWFSEAHSTNSVKSLTAELNQLLLEEFPIRGKEASERLGDILGATNG
jgi:hypothetical protein